MSALSDYLENKLVDWILRGQTWTAPTTVYFGLLTATPTDAGGGTEVTVGGGYGRVGVVCSLANFAGTHGAGTTDYSSGTSGTTSNNISIQFGSPTVNWGTIVAVGVYDASTAGNLLLWGPISPAKVINSGDLPPQFAAGQWEFNLDYVP